MGDAPAMALLICAAPARDYARPPGAAWLEGVKGQRPCTRQALLVSEQAT
jgi:hypothetical protein